MIRLGRTVARYAGSEYPRRVDFKPLDGRVYPRFSGIATFLRLPHHPKVEDLDAAIWGAPWDGATSFRPGARFGPRAVREASALMRAYSPEHGVPIFERLRVADAGDVPVSPMDVNATLAAVAEAAERTARAGAVPLFVGGDHSIALGALRGLSRAHGPLGLVHFDAHSDTYPAAWGSEYHHGTPFRKAVEEGLLDPARVVQIGLRGGLAGPDDYAFAREQGFRLIGADEVAVDPARAAEAIASVPGKVYVSWDIDAVDPSFAPGTGTPVPGGLSSREALGLARALARVEAVGFDVVEVSPPYDVSQITALLAATLLYEMLAALAARRMTSAEHRGGRQPAAQQP